MLNNCFGGSEKDYEQMAREAGIPTYMAGALYRYVEHGIRGGSFLDAVLCDSLKAATGCADAENILCLKEWAMVMTWGVPGNCHGSPEIVREWVKKKAEERKAKEVK